MHSSFPRRLHRSDTGQVENNAAGMEGTLVHRESALGGEMIYIFDIDGTIADISHRLPLIQEKPANWGAFFAACSLDEPILDMFALAWSLASTNEIVLVSGRSDECRAE